MAQPWSDNDEARWSKLHGKGYSGRNVDEEMEFNSLSARRNLAELNAKERSRKSGVLYKPAIVCVLLSFTSCGIGLGTKTWGLVGFGVVLGIVSSILNGINSKMTGQD